MPEREIEVVAEAVERALAKQRAEATREVEAILDATLRIAERSAPAAPKVADIVAEARTSNQAFYRYFTGKDDLMRAVQARGLERLTTYLEHQMAKETTPEGQISAWIKGVLAQVTDETAARQGYAINLHIARSGGVQGTDGPLEETGALLVPPIKAAGRPNAHFDARFVQDVVYGVMRRHSHERTPPDPEERHQLIRFCSGGLGLELPL